MARVDFYVLRQEGPQSRNTFACRLAEKAYRLHNTVHIHTVSRDEAERINELLWTFRDGSFVPHELLGGGRRLAPIIIGSGEGTVQPCDLLINLSDSIPVIAETFPRVAEIVSSDETSKQESRRRFAAYREKGHTLETHDV
ncbi:MAG: DNA polymerase III subunit chi [Gammaproteobacteria bacterium]|nr:DNA polymerase III subunit chi [Gammaproteobacteria bacterium]MDH5303849.1 DNA polymerase III subunit chi [Gammaproteobacteria bacterium]MDH5323186.1 DNA polymerase III subunit chi [Gammaproteobacteria bacterium]